MKSNKIVSQARSELETIMNNGLVASVARSLDSFKSSIEKRSNRDAKIFNRSSEVN